VNVELLQRQVALAAVALVAMLGSLVLGHEAPGGAPSAAEEAKTVRVAGKWYEATVGVYGPGLFGRASTCGLKLTRRTRGVAHPVLPCGARIEVAHGGARVDTRVIDKGPYGGSEDFDVTQALAAELGLSGVQVVRWRFSPGAAE
jgi:rare lipoprotein A (peptidoglycan hydrolase)